MFHPLIETSMVLLVSKVSVFRSNVLIFESKNKTLRHTLNKINERHTVKTQFFLYFGKSANLNEDNSIKYSNFPVRHPIY